MADNNDKLSLHIGAKDFVTATSGFVDVNAVPIITTKLILNRQTVASLNINNGSGNPPPITFVSAHQLNGCVSEGGQPCHISDPLPRSWLGWC